MSSLIDQLRQEAMDSSMKVSDLLAKAYVVAKSLSQSDMVEWTQNELNGYGSNEECPDYRRLRGNLVALNVYSREWCPMLELPGGEDAGESILEQVRTRPVLQGVSSMEGIVDDKSVDKVRAELNVYAQRLFGKEDSTFAQFSIEFATTQFLGVLQNVRSRILDWALQLQTDAVQAKDSSDVEKVDPKQIYFNQFFGTTIIQQGTQDSTQNVTVNVNVDTEALISLVEKLREAATNTDLDGDQRDELNSDLDTVEAQAKSSNPKMGALRECLGSLRRVSETFAGSQLGVHLPEITEAIKNLFGG
jgi:hypothetical protein